MTEPVADGAGAPQSAPDTESTGTGEQSQKSGADQQQAILRKLRKAEKELAQFRTQQEESEKGKLTETERWKSDAERYKNEAQQAKDALRQAKISHRFEAEAAKAGAQDLAAAIKLADLSTVDIDEDGSVTGIDAAISALKANHKFLFGPQTPANGVGNASGNPGSGNPMKSGADRIKSMTAAEFAAYAKQFGG